jgi:type II secretory pathway component PulM
MSAASFWRDRSPGERTVLGAVGALAGAALLVAFVWLPLERTRTRLHQQLPALRASLGVLERQADEARRLRALPPVAAAQTREPLVSILTAGGGRPLAGAELTVLDGKTLAVKATDVPFGALLEWLVSVQATQGLRVREARLEALPAAGRVRGELRLSRP